MNKLTIENLFFSGVHFGHLSKFCHKKMIPYIYGVTSKMNIIDLTKTIKCFNNAIFAITEVVSKGGVILFVGTKRCAKDYVKKYAIDCGMPFVNHRWLGGLLTNFAVIKKSIGCLSELKKLGLTLDKKELTRAEFIVLNRRLKKLSLNFDGIINLSTIPDLLVVIDSTHEKLAIREAKCLQVPIVAVVDSDSDPSGINYVIPGNDDSISSVQFYLDVISSAVLAAKKL